LCHQGNGKDGLSGAGTGPRATLHSPTVPKSTPRPDGSSPDSLLAHQESGMGGEGQVGGPLQELMSSMKAGQLGHKMNDSDIHDQLVCLLWHTQVHEYKPTLVQLGFIVVHKCYSDAFEPHQKIALLGCETQLTGAVYQYKIWATSDDSCVR